MNKKIFQAIFLVAVSILLLSFSLVSGILYQYSNDQFLMAVENEVHFIAEGIELDGLEYLESLPDVEHRITWIDASGEVLYDNQAEAGEMENHLNREEVQEALTNGSGHSHRYSTTLSTQTINYAFLLDDGSIVRLSETQSSVLAILFNLLQPLLLVLLIAIVLSAFLGHYLSKKIVQPLNNMDLDNLDANRVYEELNPLVARLALQKEEIQKKMEILTARENEFKTIIENMQEGLMVLDNEGHLLSYNHQAQQILNFNDHLKFQSILMVHQSFEVSNALHEAKSGKSIKQEMMLGDKCYQLISSPVMEDSQIVGVVMMIWDISEIHEREALRREFSANVSHELKTPLTSISGFAEIIQAGIAKEEDVKRFAGKIYDESKRLLHLVNDIIQLSELDEEGMAQKKEPCSLKSIAEDVVEKLSNSATKQNVKITTDLADLKVLGIYSVLHEMVYNIVENAIKYNKEKGEVKIKLKEKGDFVELLVKDTGIGIPFEMQERVFERFYRVDKSHSKEIGGTGLGLSIVKHGANIHHATIQLDSTLGKGTKISLAFPKYVEEQNLASTANR